MEFGPILRSMRRNKVRYGLIVAEVALTLAIVANCVNMIRDYREQTRDPVRLRRRQHHPGHAAARSRPPSRRTATSTTACARTWRRCARFPGVAAVSNTRFLPWQGGGSSMESRPLGSKGEMLRNQVYNADESTLAALGAKLIEGRNFTREETESETLRMRQIFAKARPSGADGTPLEKTSQDIIISKAFARAPLPARRQGARQAHSRTPTATRTRSSA